MGAPDLRRFAAALVLGPWLAAADPCEDHCAGDVDCLRRVTTCLQDRSRGGEAIQRLKAAVSRYPDRPELARLLAAAYLAEGNAFWAERTLAGLVQADPADCASRAWLAWVHLQAGDADLAGQTLGAAADGLSCPATAPERGRWALLRLILARARQDTAGAAASLVRLAAAGELYSEDARAAESLRRRLDPQWTRPLHVEAEASAGGTSNAGAGLPAVRHQTERGGGLFRGQVYGRLSGPARHGVRRVLEASAAGHFPARPSGDDEPAVAAARYLDVSLRPGLRLGSGAWRGAVGYRAEALVLNQGDEYSGAPQVYYEGHRLEVEAEAPGGWTAFGGAGRRLFRHRARSRWELDGGVGRAWAPQARLRLLAALSLRHYPAARAAYTHTGVNALAVARWRLNYRGPGRGGALRLGVAVGRDQYEVGSQGNGGRDLLMRADMELWMPLTREVQVGGGYEVARRVSSAAVSYPYTEHRVLLLVRVAADLDPRGPRQVGVGGRVPLPVADGVDRAGSDEERLRDLLRRDEAARRSSSCAN